MSFGQVEGIVSGAGGGTPWYLGNSFQTVLLIAAVGATTLLMLYPAADEALAASLPETEPQNIVVVDEQPQQAPADETNTETLNIDSTPTKSQTLEDPAVEEVVASNEEDTSPTLEPETPVEELSPTVEVSEEKQEELNSGDDEGDTTPIVEEQPVEEEKSEYVSRNTVLENALVDELVKSGLVSDPDNFYLKLTSRTLKVNGEKLSRDAHMSLRNLFESTADKELAAGSYVILEKVGGQSKLDMKITDFE